MKNTNNVRYWRKVKEAKKGQPLTFIHIPKCAGSFVHARLHGVVPQWQPLRSHVHGLRGIGSKGHHQAQKGEGITFAVLRDPVARFESLLNYRLERPPRGDWPQRLRYVWDDKSVDLNELVGQMRDHEILGFRPYRTQRYWSSNVDILITIDRLDAFLSAFGYRVGPAPARKNESEKTRGRFDNATKRRIARLYSDDIDLFRERVGPH